MAVRTGGTAHIDDDERNAHVAPVHSDWKPTQTVKGFCADMQATFRQIPRLPAHDAFGVVWGFQPNDANVRVLHT